jgi:hypothetical protein
MSIPIDRREGVLVGSSTGWEAARKKKQRKPQPTATSPTLEDWITALPDSAALKKDLERIKRRKQRKKPLPEEGGLPSVSTPGRSVTTGETRTRGGKIKPHRHRQD